MKFSPLQIGTFLCHRPNISMKSIPPRILCCTSSGSETGLEVFDPLETHVAYKKIDASTEIHDAKFQLVRPERNRRPPVG